ncbi:MAG: O-antigen ligase family protein [Chloroflexi bacterium]|nr:O-antigen ligase family protein [Chloroflexota bacterium]
MENQNTGVSIYKRALEIIWLAIIFLIPLFFNPQSHQIFAISKASLLVFLVVSMLAFWLADWILSPAGHKRLRWQGVFTSPLHLTILVFGLVTILATAASITPAISFWGSYFRKAGLLTLICWILFFLIVAQQIRNRTQLLRAVYTLLLSSGIVSLLGILQCLFPDIMLKVIHVKYTGRVFSTVGNPLFLSSFLAMVIPFTLALIIHSWNKITSTCHPEQQRRVSKPSAGLATSQILRSLRSRFFASLRMTGGNRKQSSDNRGKWETTIILICLVILLALQLWCLWLAQYSITILLYIIAPIIFIILLGIVKRKRLMLGLGAASLLALVIIASLLMAPLLLSDTSVETPEPEDLKSVPISEDIGLQTLGWRIQYWRSTVDLVLESPEVPFSNDRLHDFRRLIGYGPETFIVTFQLVFPEEFKSEYTYRSELIDRPHNHYLYLPATMGLLGLMSFISILAVFFYLCFRYLRRAATDIYKLLLIAMVAGMVQYMADIFFNPSTIPPELVFWLMLAMAPVIDRLTWNKEPARAEFEEVSQPESGAVSYATRTRFYLSLGCAVALIIVGTGIAIRPFLADMYFQKGINLEAQGDEQAIYAFVKATRLEPGEAIYWYRLGAYSDSVARRVTEEPLKKEILTLATDAYDKSRKLRPYIALGYYYPAGAYTYWAKKGAVDKWPTALSLYDKASQLFPRNAVILNKWSLALIAKGDLDEARTKLDYAASIDPDWAETSFLYGLLLAKEGKNDEAVLKLTAPIQDNPANLNYFIDLCRYFMVYDIVSPLIDSLEIYTQEMPDDWIAHTLLGPTSLFGGDVDKSLDELNTAMLLVPSNDAGHLFRAILKLSTLSPQFKTALPGVAAEWRAKLAQSPERDTLLPELDKLVGTSQ